MSIEKLELLLNDTNEAFGHGLCFMDPWRCSRPRALPTHALARHAAACTCAVAASKWCWLRGACLRWCNARRTTTGRHQAARGFHAWWPSWYLAAQDFCFWPWAWARVDDQFPSPPLSLPSGFVDERGGMGGLRAWVSDRDLDVRIRPGIWMKTMNAAYNPNVCQSSRTFSPALRSGRFFFNATACART